MISLGGKQEGKKTDQHAIRPFMLQTKPNVCSRKEGHIYVPLCLSQIDCIGHRGGRSSHQSLPMLLRGASDFFCQFFWLVVRMVK